MESNRLDWSLGVWAEPVLVIEEVPSLYKDKWSRVMATILRRTHNSSGTQEELDKGL